MREPELGAQVRELGLWMERRQHIDGTTEPVGVLVDAQDGQPGIGEGERERQPDPAQPDDGDVVAHAR